MKKIYSLIAALVVAMVVLVSCGGDMAYKAELENAKAAVEKKDWATVDKVCSTIEAGKDKATAMDLALAFVYKFNACSNKFQEANVAGGTIDLDGITAGFQNALGLLSAAKAKPDYEETAKALQILGQDLAQYETASNQSIENLKNLAAQAQAAAAAAEEGDAEEEEE